MLVNINKDLYKEIIAEMKEDGNDLVQAHIKELEAKYSGRQL